MMAKSAGSTLSHVHWSFVLVRISQVAIVVAIGFV